MSRHEGVSCDHCKKNNIRGLRYKCLICINFDLCQDCQLSSAEPSNHSKEHPMQCVLTKNDADLYFSGELESHQEAFTCPYCGRMGLSEEQLEEHVNRDHTEDELDRDVQCPICAVAGTETGAREDFLGHLTISHRSGPLMGLVPGARRLRRGGGRGRRGESLVDLLAHLGATGQARAPLRTTIHHSHPQPVPAAQLGRWSLLAVGVSYGMFWQSRYTKRELAMKDVKLAEKAARDAKIAAEKKAAAAAEMAELEKLGRGGK